MAHYSHLFDRNTKIILLIIILVAAFFRFFNLNWDLGHFFHPDERNIANAVSQIKLFSQMDPKFYAYGGFLIYLYKFTADILVTIFQNPTMAQDWGWINIIGRSYSAFFSLLTIFPIYYLGVKLFNKYVGLLAAVIYALTVSSIQTAHFSTTENLLTLLVALITSLSLTFYEKPSLKKSLVLGVILGIAVATKTTGASFGIVPFIALSLLFVKRKLNISMAFLNFILLALTAFLIFTLFSPFTFLNFSKFMESMHYENSVVLGTNPVVYTLQFLHTPSYLFQLMNLFWQMGIFAFFAIVGTLLTIYLEFKKKHFLFLIFISFPILYFLYIGSWYTKFNRYMVPIFPFIILCGANLLFLLYKRYKRVGQIVIAGVILMSGLYAVAFLSIYNREQTRISTSKWIYSHVPPNSFILSEHWDDGQPIPLNEGSPGSYRTLPLTIYDQDNDAKVTYYAEYLSQADYLTINSRRLYGTLLHLPDKYPLTKRYYELLFAEKLGYQKVAEFSSYPQLFGIYLNDDSSEESFQVYDHPKTFIFKNTKRFPPSQIQSLLQSK